MIFVATPNVLVNTRGISTAAAHRRHRAVIKANVRGHVEQREHPLPSVLAESLGISRFFDDSVGFGCEDSTGDNCLGVSTRLDR